MTPTTGPTIQQIAHWLKANRKGYDWETSFDHAVYMFERLSAEQPSDTAPPTADEVIALLQRATPWRPSPPPADARRALRR